jgi:hypothetical protein
MHDDPEVTFWIDDDIFLELKDAGEFEFSDEMTISFTIGGRCWNLDSPEKVKKELIAKYPTELKKQVKKPKLGYGNCPDCHWYKDKEGCNVERDSKQCLLNKKIKGKNEHSNTRRKVSR